MLLVLVIWSGPFAHHALPLSRLAPLPFHSAIGVLDSFRSEFAPPVRGRHAPGVGHEAGTSDSHGSRSGILMLVDPPCVRC